MQCLPFLETLLVMEAMAEYTDTASGTLSARPGLDQALNKLDEGDTVDINYVPRDTV